MLELIDQYLKDTEQVEFDPKSENWSECEATGEPYITIALGEDITNHKDDTAIVLRFILAVHEYLCEKNAETIYWRERPSIDTVPSIEKERPPARIIRCRLSVK